MTANEILTQEDIDYVCRLVTEAGTLAIKLRSDIEIKIKSGPFDKVTSADFALSRLIVDKLLSRFPTDCIISEEDFSQKTDSCARRAWLVDPIDGTENYISNDGQYSVMIGLLIDNKPVYGWVYAPTSGITYYGGPGFGAWRQLSGNTATKFSDSHQFDSSRDTRLVMGWRDRKAHPWVMDMPNVRIVKTGSIGLKVAKVLDNEADLLVYLSGKLKSWDTAGPIAIALGGGLEVGTIEGKDVDFPTDAFVHDSSVIIGRPGCINWAKTLLVKPST